MIVKPLTERHMELLSLKDGCRGSSESTLALCCKISCKWVHRVLSFLGYNFSVFSDLSKKINKQINKLGDCPGNEIKVLLELLWAVDYNHSSKKGSRFYSSDN